MSVLLKHTLNCCKLQKSFQNKTRIMPFISKTAFLNILLLVLPISFIHCELWNQPYYSKYERYLNLRTDKHIGISPLLKSNLSLRMTLQAIIYYFDDYDDLWWWCILWWFQYSDTWEPELKKSMWHQWEISHFWIGKLHRYHCTCSSGHGNRIFVRNLFII